MYFDVDDDLRWALRLMAADRNKPSVVQLVNDVIREAAKPYLADVERRKARGEASHGKSNRGRKPGGGKRPPAGD